MNANKMRKIGKITIEIESEKTKFRFTHQYKFAT